MKVNQRCRVYGHFLTEARERRGGGGGGGGGEGVHTNAESLRRFALCAINTGNIMA